jgi:hypothetical protein
MLIKNRLLLGDYRYWCTVFYMRSNSDIIDAVYVSTDDSTIKQLLWLLGK